VKKERPKHGGAKEEMGKTKGEKLHGGHQGKRGTIERGLRDEGAAAKPGNLCALHGGGKVGLQRGTRRGNHGGTKGACPRKKRTKQVSLTLFLNLKRGKEDFCTSKKCEKGCSEKGSLCADSRGARKSITVKNTLFRGEKLREEKAERGG